MTSESSFTSFGDYFIDAVASDLYVVTILIVSLSVLVLRIQGLNLSYGIDFSSLRTRHSPTTSLDRVRPPGSPFSRQRVSPTLWAYHLLRELRRTSFVERATGTPKGEAHPLQCE